MGLNNRPDRFYQSLMVNLFEDVGDIAFPPGYKRGDKVEIKSDLVALAIGKDEFLPYATRYYLYGRDYFLENFGRVFGPDKAAALYDYMKTTLFDGREYRPGELEQAARNFLSNLHPTIPVNQINPS